MHPRVDILADVPGYGDEVQRHRYYDIRLRIWLSRGELVRWGTTRAPGTGDRLEDHGTTLFTTIRVHRGQLFPGLFYGVEGMRIGGVRRFRVAPHLGYGEAGIPGVIPPNALLTVEVEVLSEREISQR